MPQATDTALREHAMPNARRARFTLTRWFALAGAISIGVFALALSLALSRYIETVMLKRDAAISRDFVQSIANIQQVAGFFRAPQADPAPSVAEFFAHVAAMPDVLRANVYSPTRQVLWSSQRELIGKTFAANDELDEALRGEVVVNLEDDEHEAAKAERQGLKATSLGFVENYVPVYDEKRRELIGVIELYRQPTALLQAIADGQRLIRIGAVLGGAFLFLVLVGFVLRTERALQVQQQRLLQAETMAAIGEISAAVAHSIRNPLVSIRTSAELQREIAGDEGGTLGEIMRNVDRVEHLVRTLLTYAAEPGDRNASADLGAVLHEAAGRFAPELRAQGKPFLVQIAPGLGAVDADPVVLAQVMNSLLANAAEATAAGDAVELHAASDGPNTHVEVLDRGAGIPPERMDQIFKPFFTTKPRGLGMGLPLARRIAERLGGTLELAARDGGGTRVRLTLPRGAAPSQAGAGTASGTGTGTGTPPGHADTP